MTLCVGLYPQLGNNDVTDVKYGCVHWRCRSLTRQEVLQTFETLPFREFVPISHQNPLFLNLIRSCNIARSSLHPNIQYATPPSCG